MNYADIYTTVAGDMWDAIAFRIYGAEQYMAQLMAANPTHAATLVFDGGVELVVPDIEITAATNLPPWRRS